MNYRLRTSGHFTALDGVAAVKGTADLGGLKQRRRSLAQGRRTATALSEPALRSLGAISCGRVAAPFQWNPVQQIIQPHPASGGLGADVGRVPEELSRNLPPAERVTEALQSVGVETPRRRNELSRLGGARFCYSTGIIRCA